jgi:PAS domain S-box-containing protein
MNELDHFMRAEPIARARDPSAGEAAEGGAASSPQAGLPEFGVRAMREFDGSQAPMRIFDLETFRYLAVNEAAVRFYGYTREEFLAMTVLDTRHPGDHQQFYASLAEQADYLRHRPLRRHIRKNGETVLVEVITQDVLFNGRKARLSLTLDLTGRIRVEELLWQRQQEFESLAENIPDLVARFDRNLRYVYVNSADEELIGRARSEIIGRTPRELGMPRDFVEAFERSLNEVIETGRPDLLEFRFPGPDGDRLYEAHHVPERDMIGEIGTVLCVARDITQRKRVHDALRESEERFRQLAENIDQVFWINTLSIDTNMYVSPAYERIWGRSCESLRQNPNGWLEAIYPEDLPRLREALEGVARGADLDVEYRIVRPDGTLRWIRDRSYRMKAGDGPPLLCGIAQDITDSKLAEHERLSHAIHQRDALVREVHHRIKNSLQGIVGLLRQKIRRYPAIRIEMEEAIAQLQSVALVYGLQETRSDGLISLAEIVDEVCVSAEGLTGGLVERARERKTSRPACVAGSEAVSVAVALNELVFNALKHQAGTGRKRAQVTLLESKDGAEIRIANRGKLPKGFDYPGERALGHGLGLVRTLLAAPGGNVRFNGGRNEVEVVLELRPPLIAARRKAIAT